jgi:hypothetical protein
VVGIQSASDETRRSIFGRTETRDEILQADAILSRHGVGKHYDFLIDHFWESDDELEQTFALVSELQRPFHLNMHSVVVLPHTELARRAVREQKLTEQEILEAITADPRTSSRRVNWVRGVPDPGSPARRHWLFLVFSSARPFVPRWLVERLARSRVLRRHPGLLGGDMGLVNWIAEEDTMRFAMTRRGSRLFSALSARWPALAGRLSRLSLFLEWLARVGQRILTRVWQGTVRRIGQATSEASS